MHFEQLNLQKENQSLSTQLDFLKVLSIRGSAYFTKFKKRHLNLEAGQKGEQKVMDYIQQYGASHWIVLHNIWLQDFNRFECDLILITNHTIYIFEIKYYKGIFRYDNGKCFYDSIETSLNPIEQARGNLVNLKKILSNTLPHMTIQAGVIFAGEDHEIQVISAPDDIKIVTSNGIRNFILNIAKEEEKVQTSPINAVRVIQELNKYEIPHPFQPEPLTHDEMKEIRPGIYCANCHSFDVKITKFKVSCRCGLTESREEAIVRTICDYGVLNYKSELTTGELMNFFSKQISRYLLIETLHKHFTMIKNGKYTYYLNKKLPYENIRSHFTIKESRIFHHKNDMLSVLHI